ncbi:hypothetical protein CAPTEDRAFT_207161 [Capitella teleta]|uniref:Uncharacterized protein n=1 Tax=Capitella teleta TaxID=283909 RepID=R7VAN7_CAPTE|nr:hypothetical protein CAPTEDRAFT_207161 [Capitella teleta]|eukprot:ELU15597.1 hypothetical protein CAPTEDRAFT_207161 [Capitella teleta]
MPDKAGVTRDSQYSIVLRCQCPETAIMSIEWGENPGALARLVEPSQNQSDALQLRLGGNLDNVPQQSVVGAVAFASVFVAVLLSVACIMIRKLRKPDDEDDEEDEEDSQPINSVSKSDGHSVGVSIPLLTARI